MRRRRQVISAVVLVIVAVAGYLGYLFGTVSGVIGSADRSQHVAGNEALLRQVPVYPGARYQRGYTTGSKENNGWPEGFFETLRDNAADDDFIRHPQGEHREIIW